MKPFLRNEVPVSFEAVPEATVYEAGYLVTKKCRLEKHTTGR